MVDEGELHNIYIDGLFRSYRNADDKFNLERKNFRDSFLKTTAYEVNLPVAQCVFNSSHVDLSMSHINPLKNSVEF